MELIMRSTSSLWMWCLIVFALTAAPAAAQGSWSLAASGIIGGTLPLKVNGLKISDPTVPLNLTSDGGVNRKAHAVGGQFRAFKRRTAGAEWGFNVDMRTFRYDGKAGIPTHVYGTVEGHPVDDIEISGGDHTRVTMTLAALLVRWPIGRSPERPDGRWSPYIGVGGGNQRAHIASPAPSFTTNAPAIQALGGAEVMVSRRIGLFGEYRFERIKDQVTMDTTRVQLQLKTNHLAGGVSLHF
jgi:opacity protein-like surface antigen